MNWTQLAKRQAKEYKEYINGFKESLEQLNADRILLLGQHTIASAPENVRDKINRDHEAWKAEWSINGQQLKTLRMNHSKELTAFFQQFDR
jgi:hypothetical protein